MINVHKIWMDEQNATNILKDVFGDKVSPQADPLWTLKIKLNKILKYGDDIEKTNLYIMFEAPIEKVLEYLHSDDYNEAVLWRINHQQSLQTMGRLGTVLASLSSVFISSPLSLPEYTWLSIPKTPSSPSLYSLFSR